MPTTVSLGSSWAVPWAVLGTLLNIAPADAAYWGVLGVVCALGFVANAFTVSVLVPLLAHSLGIATVSDASVADAWSLMPFVLFVSGLGCGSAAVFLALYVGVDVEEEVE